MSKLSIFNQYLLNQCNYRNIKIRDPWDSSMVECYLAGPGSKSNPWTTSYPDVTQIVWHYNECLMSTTIGYMVQEQR